ncbi:hypothetical protein SRO_6493 [Streptomyces rochei]|nr:hypothetical protein SRO_6493 [Streptomyces rochei]
MGNVQGMLATARSLLGTTEHPPGSNRNVITKWYGFTGPGPPEPPGHTGRRRMGRGDQPSAPEGPERGLLLTC